MCRHLQLPSLLNQLRRDQIMSPWSSDSSWQLAEISNQVGSSGSTQASMTVMAECNGKMIPCCMGHTGPGFTRDCRRLTRGDDQAI